VAGADTAVTPDAAGANPPPDPLRFVGLDGARAVAAMGVFLAHAAFISGYVFRSDLGPVLARADIGVEIFFLLSGFLLYRPFVARRLAGEPTGDLATYARRRFLRIFPAYWVALTIVAFVLQAPRFEDEHSIVAHYLLLHVLDIKQVSHGPIQQAWTLSCEIVFYAVLPMWAWLMARRPRTPERQLRVELGGLAALWAGAMLLKAAVIVADPSIERVGWLATWFPFRVDQFALGMALAVVSAWVQLRRIQLAAWFRGAGGVLLCWAAALGGFLVLSFGFHLPLDLEFTPKQFWFTRTSFSFIALLFLVPIVLGRQDGGIVRTTVASRPVVWLGLVSYGIYLWHEAWMFKWLEWTGEPALGAAFLPMAAVTLVLTVLCGAASWYLIERPVMGWRNRTVDREREPSPELVGAGARDGGDGVR
jgi:peptidoglycan/LPS O-acetylase OafA/YrhL